MNLSLTLEQTPIVYISNLQSVGVQPCTNEILIKFYQNCDLKEVLSDFEKSIFDKELYV